MDSITRNDVCGIHHLAPMQESILFSCLLNSGTPVYFEQMQLEVTGKLNVDYLEKSFNIILERHDALRTIFLYEKLKRPVQMVLKERKTKVSYEDISHLSSEKKKKYIDRIAAEDREKGFDLLKDVLMRVIAVKLEPNKYRLIWSHHHIIMDGWCLGLIVKELLNAYYSLAANEKLVLENPSQYGEYLEWLDKQDRAAALGYWENYLKGYRQKAGLLSCDNKKTVMQYENRDKIFKINEDFTRKIRSISVRNSVTVNTVLQSVWGILLHKYNNTDDAVFGAVVSGRPAELKGVEKTVGLFINTIPVRIHAQEGMSFTALIREVQANALKSDTKSYLPLSDIQEKTELKSNLLDHVFIVENFPLQSYTEVAQTEKQNLSVKSIGMFEQTGYDFNVIIAINEEIEVTFKYNGCIYSDELVDKIKSHFMNIVGQVTGEPELQLSEIELLTAEERNLILHDFNNNVSEYPRDKTIHQLFDEQVSLTPDSTAVVYEGRRLTYKEFNSKVLKLAGVLITRGVKPGSIVGIRLERSIEQLVCIMAILKAGGAYLPIDTECPAERAMYMLEDSQACLLLTQKGWAENIEFNSVYLEETALDKKAYSNEPVKSRGGAEGLAYILYTSGSTGKPKGVMISHRNVVNILMSLQEIYPLKQTDTYLFKTPYTFDVSVSEIFGWFMGGGSLLILKQGEEKNPVSIIEAIETGSVTHVNFVPSMLNVWLDEVERMGKRNFSSLKYVFSAGEELKQETAQKFYRCIEGVGLSNLYGPTEATVYATGFSVKRNHCGSNIPIGKPFRNIRVYIVDKKNCLLPVGFSGELCIAGDGLALGYLYNEQLTKERFVEKPSVPEERMYRTGDLARWLPDGNIEFLGRMDQQVKIRGYRMELTEIESSLLSMSMIKEAAVTVREDNSGLKYLCAYVTASKELTVQEIREHLLTLLPEYMVPSCFVYLKNMPLSANGKVNRKALPEPDGYLPSGTEYKAPTNETERDLVNLWQEILDIERIGINDDFFELGGHSLKALSIMGRMEKLGYSVTLTDIYYYRTVKAISSYLNSNQGKSGLLQSREAVLAYLHSETGFLFEWGCYRITRPKSNKAKEINILYCDCSLQRELDNITGLIREKVDKGLAPHYILPLERKIQMDGQEFADENIFYSRLGLKDFGGEQAAELLEAIREDYRKKNHWLKSGRVLCQYKLSSVQQMQILFDTPPSYNWLVMDEYVDIDCMEKAYEGLLKSQGLLRSVPVKGKKCVMWKEFELSPENFPGLLVVDLSEYNLRDDAVSELWGQVLEKTRFKGENILSQVILIKSNMREYHIFMLYHHVICDRVTYETAQRQLLTYYRALMRSGRVELEKVRPYSDYVRQIESGPKNITEQELITKYHMEEFYQAKKVVLNKMDNRRNGRTYLFTIYIPTENPSLEFALSVITRAVQKYTGIDKVPLLFVYEGRKYEKQAYYNTVGEFVDFVPLLLDPGMKPGEILYSVKTRLDNLVQYNINFFNLLVNPDAGNSWSRTRKLALYGENFEFIDILMFNYLGNADESEQIIQNGGGVTVVPDMLPIPTLLNCIAHLYNGGLNFSFRCSYETDVEKLTGYLREIAGELTSQ